MTVNRLLEYTRDGTVINLSGDLILHKGTPRVQVINPDIDNRIVTLPDFKILSKGGPHFYIINIHDTFNLLVKSFSADEEFTLAPEKGGVFSTFRNVGNVGWFVDIRDLIGSAIGELAP